MMRCRKRPDRFKAFQFFPEGEGNEDGNAPPDTEPSFGLRMVPYNKEVLCPKCGGKWGRHGQLGSGEVVCPGNYVVMDPEGSIVVYDEARFLEIFEPLT